jgi:hypothetical protein
MEPTTGFAAINWTQVLITAIVTGFPLLAAWLNLNRKAQVNNIKAEEAVTVATATAASNTKQLGEIQHEVNSKNSSLQEALAVAERDLSAVRSTVAKLEERVAGLQMNAAEARKPQP